MKKVLSLALAVLLIASVIVSVPITASAFNADNYKANITKISVGAPITGTDEKKYLPVTVYFTADEDLGDSNAVSFLEGYLKGMLANGDKFEGISGLGMTLIGPLKPDALEGMGSNAFSWQWSEGYGEGVLKYNIPLKEESDTQSIEHSSATGQDELNCVTEGDKVSFQIETVMNSSNFPPGVLPEGGSLFSDERTITIEDSSKYPKTIEFGNTCTITVHYVYAEGGQAAPDKVETCEIGLENFLINSPTIEGYTPDKNVVTGIPSGDKEFTVTYTKNSTTPSETVGSDEAPVITKAAYDPETKKLDVSFTTKDMDSRYFEAYMLTDKILEKGMGKVTFKGKDYDTLGIQSFNSDDASHVTVNSKTGAVTLSQELYFGENEAPAIGETVYIAVQTEGKHAKDSWGEGSELSELKTIVVGTPDAPEKKSIKDANVKVASGGTYTGKAKKPAVTVTYDGSKLKSGVDFTVTYTNNKNAGTAKAVVKGVGDYQDSVTVKFKIAKAGNKVKVTGKAVSVKAKTLKKKNASFKVAVITNAQGKVKVTLTANKLKGKLSINNDGKITIKKGKYAKETYKVKISVTAAGNTNYTSKTITKTIKIKIK